MSVSRVFALLSGSPTSRRREPSRALAPKSCVKTAATADQDSKWSSGKFLKGGKKTLTSRPSSLGQVGFAAEVGEGTICDFTLFD